MANRRMFSLKIIDTDMFLDMPITARLLYYDMAMRADDDGFVGSPKKIQKMVGSSDDDMKILIAKQFLIPFESGVCVIKHWRVHNYIQTDRYNATFYKYEKSMLLTQHGTYELMDTKCIQNVSEMDTQDRLELGKSKVRLGKDSIDNSKKKKETEIDEVINNYTNLPELQTTLKDYVVMRKSIKKPLTTKALELVLKKLDNIGTNEFHKIQILEQSIMNSWQGVFELKQDFNSNKESNNPFINMMGESPF